MSRASSEVPGASTWSAVAVGAAAALLFLTGLGGLDLWAPDEPRYAQIADEVRASGEPSGWILLHLNGEPYSQKPPLFFWLAAALGLPFGRVSEGLARLPSALAGVACALLLVRFGRRLFPERPHAAAWSAVVLISSFLFAHVARRAQLDVLLTAFETAALLGLWLSVEAAPANRHRLVFVSHLALAAAVLTKGPVGLLPLGVLGAYLVWERRLGDWRLAVPAWAWLVCLGPPLAWAAAAVWLAPPGFAADALGDNLLGRFLEGTSHARAVWYYAYQLPLGFLPWTLCWPLAFAAARRDRGSADPERRRAWRWLASWAGLCFVLFSLSAGKRGLYLLPLFPALALACGAGLADASARGTRLPRALSALLAAAAAAIAGLGVFIAASGGLSLRPGFEVPALFGVVMLVLAGLAFAIVRTFVGRWLRVALPVAAALWGSLLLGAFLGVLPGFDAEKSPRGVANAALALAEPGEPIGVFRRRALVGGLAYYAEVPVAAVEDAEGALRFFARGGRVLVGRLHLLEELGNALPDDVTLSVSGSVRSARRQLFLGVLASPADASPPTVEHAAEPEER